MSFVSEIAASQEAVAFRNEEATPRIMRRIAELSDAYRGRLELCGSHIGWKLAIFGGATIGGVKTGQNIEKAQG